jgi:hypothetical protein
VCVGVACVDVWGSAATQGGAICCWLSGVGEPHPAVLPMACKAFSFVIRYAWRVALPRTSQACVWLFRAGVACADVWGAAATQGGALCCWLSRVVYPINYNRAVSAWY